MIQAVGVDACPGGWVSVELRNQRLWEIRFNRLFAEILEEFPEATAVGVDMPIGLPTAGRRAADQAARRFVGPRRSSVFFTPTRALLEGAWAPGLGMSKQSYAIGAGILEVDAALQDRVYEVHPEVCFAALKGEPLLHSKRSWNGLMERRRLLAAAGIEIPDDLAAPGAIPPADVLDAAAVAWSAHRVATGAARTLPESPPAPSGRLVAIWY